jgi:hypothetical protein
VSPWGEHFFDPHMQRTRACYAQHRAAAVVGTRNLTHLA